MNFPIQRVTPDDGHYWFGYYDKCPWSHDGRFLLSMRAAFKDRWPTAQDEAVIGLIDLHNGNRFQELATTRAWNWQQGAMLQWLPDGQIIFNDRIADADGERFASVILNPHTATRRVLPQSIHTLTWDGTRALTLNYSRQYDTRPGYGYDGIPDPHADNMAPDNDGVFCMDIASGQTRLILSLRELSQRIGNPAGKHWINHLQWNTDGTRFVMLHRYGNPKAKGLWWTTRMLTADADGGNICELGAQGMVSHFDWRDAQHLLAWARRDDQNRFFGYHDQTDKVEIVADGLLKVDGHCSYSPDRRWLMSDEYPDKSGNRALFLFEPATQRLEEAGRFYGPFPSDHETRTDLHARWNRDGTQICIDSIHEGPRAMYVLDVPPSLTQTR